MGRESQLYVLSADAALQRDDIKRVLDELQFKKVKKESEEEYFELEKAGCLIESKVGNGFFVRFNLSQQGMIVGIVSNVLTFMCNALHCRVREVYGDEGYSEVGVPFSDEYKETLKKRIESRRVHET